jgi:ubiquinone/menaquinone biosynthesis C-methylase UbiE
MHARLFLWLWLAAPALSWAAGAAGMAAESRVERYANEARREVEWKVPEMFDALGVRPGSQVADIGAGNGFTAVRLAAVVGAAGKVFAVDIDERVMTELDERAGKLGLTNLETIRAKEADPLLRPGSLDAALMVRCYHEFTQHQEMLAHVRAALKPGGRLVIVDQAPAADSRGQSRESQFGRHVLEREIAEKDLVQAGFRIVRSVDAFAKPSDGPGIWLVAAEAAR